jgi:CheY-like chemotaxis protein
MRKVLLINPDSDSLARDKSILDRDDLRIFTATTAEEGFRIHWEERVNLLLTELDLPDLGGDVLCSRIRQGQGLRQVSMVVVCKDLPEEIARAEGCGANALLVKPVTPEQLDDCVGKLLAIPVRRDCRVLVRVQVHGESGAAALFCTSRNVSVSGLRIESDGLLAVGDRISCMFFLPGTCQIKSVGTVVWTVRLSRLVNQYGIRFVSLYPQAKTELENFVAANAQAA